MAFHASFVEELRWSSVLALSLAGVLGAPDAARAAVQVSGTVVYTGQQGPVSASRPIEILAISDASDNPGDAVFAPVQTSPGAFVLNLSAPGDYLFGMVLDVMADGNPNVGEPFQIYDHRFDMSGPPLHVPDGGIGGLILTFDDTGILSGIGGTVTYNGSHLGTSPGSKLRLVLTSDAHLTMFVDEQSIDGSSGRFDLVTFDTNPYYLLAFADMNGNKSFDGGEPFTIYRDKASPPGDPIVAGPMRNALDITFGDENFGTPTPTPTATPTAAPCDGDCGLSGSVTVDDLVTMASIALGNTAVSACSAGDVNRDGKITVDEVVGAVNNLLTGCVTNQ